MGKELEKTTSELFAKSAAILKEVSDNPKAYSAEIKENHIGHDGTIWNECLKIVKDGEIFVSCPANGKFTYYVKLGFRLDSLAEIQFNQSNWANVPKDIDNILNYAMALVGYMNFMANKKHLHKNDWNRTIFIDTLDVNTTDFDLPTPKIEKLIESGKNGVKKHFEWRKQNLNNKPA